jgi:hypothetical protein
MTAPLVLNYRCGVARKIVQRQPLHRSAAAPGAARLRTQDAETGLGQLIGETIEILQPAAARRQHDDQWPAALRDDFDAHVVVSDDFAQTLGPRRHREPRKRRTGEGRREAAQSATRHV